MDDDVTGARVDVTLTVDMAPERFWDLVTDVSRISEWSPECTYAAWIEDGDPVVRAGARFEGRNQFPNGFVSSVTCVVTEAVWPSTFAFVVLDGQGDPERPGSVWRYEWSPADSPERSVVRHSFVHGPGNTGARRAAQVDPVSFAGRLDALRDNMTATVMAMTRGDDNTCTTEEGR
jgi:uncharacterized protein YndB with AHSA1/START domain